MLEKHWVAQQFRWIYIILLACCCLSGLWLNKENDSKKLYSWIAEQSQSHQENHSNCSILSQQKTFPPIYVIRPLSLKQETILLKCKKTFAQVFHVFSLINDILTIHLSEYLPPTYSYQFSRLNVLSSQAHPPTL